MSILCNWGHKFDEVGIPVVSNGKHHDVQGNIRDIYMVSTDIVCRRCGYTHDRTKEVTLSPKFQLNRREG